VLGAGAGRGELGRMNVSSVARGRWYEVMFRRERHETVLRRGMKVGAGYAARIRRTRA
jgi:hypothetical protein